MLPKNRRIPRKDFKHILSNSKKYIGDFLIMYVVEQKKDTKIQPTRFSFSVSKKVCSRAVDRNKNRRRGYGVVAESINRVRNGLFIFFVFKKAVEYSELKKDINKLLSGAGVV